MTGRPDMAIGAPEVARLLREFGQRTALRGGNPYRAKAYVRAADNILALNVPLEELIAHDRLRDIPGVGSDRRHCEASACGRYASDT